MINKEAAKDPKVYLKLVRHDDTSDVSIATICGTNMAETTRAVCAKAEGGNYRDLAEYCSADGKGGEPVKRSSSQSSDESGASGSASDSMMDGAKKLKGLFGF
jgi:hypothetical protein